MADVLVLRGHLTQSLGNALSSGEHSLDSVPKLLSRVLDERAWERRVVVETGEVFEGFTTIDEYVQASAPKGLGVKVEMVDRLIQDDKDLVVRFRKARKRKPPGIATSSHNVTVSKRGNGESYALEWLSKNRDDLYQQVKADAMSAHAAMIAAGQRERTLTVPLNDMERLARALCRHLDAQQRHELAERLSKAG